MSDNYIQTQSLTKIYKLKSGEQIPALNQVDLGIKEHEIFGIVGPNGAGKTTLIKILCTLLQPTSGKVLIDGLDVKENIYAIRRKVGVMFDSGIAYPDLSGYNNLKFWAKMYRIENYDEQISNILKELDLIKWKDEIVASYSLGMMLKVAIGRLILTNPAIWILDEPTRGMDIHSLLKMVQLLKMRKKTNTIIVTSHDLTIMDKLCDRIAIIDRGTILAVDSPENLKILQGDQVAIDIGIMENVVNLEHELQSENLISQINATNLGFSIILTDKKLYPKLFSILKKYPITSINEKKHSLEEMFIKITKKVERQ